MQSLRICGSVALAITAFLGFVDRASGAPLTFHFEGYVTQIHGFLELDESVFIGAPFSGGYTFDPVGAFDSNPDSQVGNYYFPPPARLWCQVGNYEFATADLIMFVHNDRLSGDLYEPVSITPFVAGGYEWSGMVVFLLDETGAALDSDALPVEVPDLANFASDTSFGIFLPGNDLGIGGTLTSLTPEPGTIVVLVLGAAGMVCRRSRR